MTPVLWMKSSCTACRAAKAELAKLGVEVEIRDYYKRPLTPQELAGLLPEDPAPMLGTKSPKYRELGLKGRKLSKAEAIDLMVEDNNLLKRPILIHPQGVIIGFDRDAYDALARSK